MARRAQKGLLGSLNTGQGNSWDQYSRRRFELCLVVRNLFGAAGRARSAHIVQFGAVGVERPGKELAEEFADADAVRPDLVAGGRGGNGCRIDDRHDESCLFSGVF